MRPRKPAPRRLATTKEGEPRARVHLPNGSDPRGKKLAGIKPAPPRKSFRVRWGGLHARRWSLAPD
jgi:hypothetical protein